MKRNTTVLITVLFMVGILVSLSYIALSFLGYAIISWTIVVITVFTVLIYELYD